MKLRRYRLAAGMAATAWFAAVAPAQSPNHSHPTYSAVATGQSAVSPDQALADAVAEKLGRSIHFTGYSVDVLCDHGQVELVGTVQAAGQKAELVKAVKTVKGVKAVKDSLTVVKAGEAETPNELKLVNGPHGSHGGPGMPTISGPIPNGVVSGDVGGGVVSGPIGGGQVIHGGPMMGGGPMGGPVMGGFGMGSFNDPMPIGPSTMGGFDAAPPRLPPYAWPTYAPHNNYSRVGYPTEYPPEAFPFMGPFYPFPKVPLGYRAIKLEWEDGHWWYGRNATKRDWWKIRYW